MKGRKKQVVQDELIQDDVQPEVELQHIPSNVMPATLEGKAVSKVINGKVRIYSYKRKKFITGFIEPNLAIKAVGDKDHLKIVQHGEEI